MVHLDNSPQALQKLFTLAKTHTRFDLSNNIYTSNCFYSTYSNKSGNVRNIKEMAISYMYPGMNSEPILLGTSLKPLTCVDRSGFTPSSVSQFQG